MDRQLITTFLALVASSIVFAALPSSFPVVSPPSPLPAAVVAGDARVKIHAVGVSSGDSLRMEVTNLDAKEKVWSVPRGCVATAQDAVNPDMAIRALKGRVRDAGRYIPASLVSLGPNETASFLCEAYSLDFKKPNPVRGAEYKLAPARPFLARLFVEADRLKLSLRATQAAVWIHAGKVEREDLQQDFPVSPQEFAMAQGAVRISEEAMAAQARAIATPAGLPSSRGIAGIPGLPVPGSPGAGAVSPAPGAMLTLEPMKRPGPILAGGEELPDGGGRPLYRLKYRWNVPLAQRPRVYAICFRWAWEGETAPAAVDQALLEAEEGEILISDPRARTMDWARSRPKGEILCGIFRDVTIATDQSRLESLLNDTAESRALLLSNRLLVSIGLDAPASAPASAPMRQ